MSGLYRWIGRAAVCMALLSAVGLAAEVEQSVIAPLADQSLLLDAALAGQRVVVVGERGHVLLSDDGGESWRQVQVPTRATLNGVRFVNDQLGFAVGHDAVILRTQDGGESWERVFAAPDEERPLFDVWFRDEQHGFAVGAYSLFLTSADGGSTWTLDELVVVEEEEEGEEGEEGDSWDDELIVDYHLHHIARSQGGLLYIAAEAGSLYRSKDDGATWGQVFPPYEGSYFASLPLSGDSLLIMGLRGHLLRSDDAGDTWREIETGTQAMLNDAVRLPDGTIVVVGLDGAILTSEDGGETFQLHPQEDRLGISSVVSTGGRLVVAGEGGVRAIDLESIRAGGGR